MYVWAETTCLSVFLGCQSERALLLERLGQILQYLLTLRSIHGLSVYVCMYTFYYVCMYVCMYVVTDLWRSELLHHLICYVHFVL
jgi:hypothetical protein